jgi:DNA repair protein RecO
MIKVFSEEGFTSFYVRKALQVKSSTLGSVALGSFSTFHLKENKKHELKLNTIEFHNHIMSSLPNPDAYLVIEAMLELVNKTIEQEEAIDLYPIFVTMVSLAKTKPYLALYQFLTHIIHLNGLDLVHHECVICHQKKAIIGISYHDGGVVCQTCALKHDVIALPKDALLAIVYPHKDEFIQALNNEQLKKTIEIFRLHLVHQLNVSLIALENLRQFSH